MAVQLSRRASLVHTPIQPRSIAAILAMVFAVVAVAMSLQAERASAAYNILDFQLTPSTTQAGGHPNTHYHVDPDANNADATGGDDLKKVVLDYPAGLLGNPEAATPKCVASGSGSTNKFNNDACPASSYIGSMSIQWREAGGKFVSAPGSVYVLTPSTSGSAATIGFIVRPQGWRKVFLKTEVKGLVSVRTGTEADYGLTLTIDNIPRTLTSLIGTTKSITISDISVNINSRAGGTSTTSPNGPYFTFNPTRCTPANTKATITSYKNVVNTRNTSFTPTECGSVPFNPTANVKPLNQTPGAATGVEATFTVPTADAPIQQSHVRNIQTDLPVGTGLNMPAIGAVPALCTESQLNADTCPSGAKIGTVSAAVPFLPPTMTGDVYLLTRNSSITFGYILRSSSSGIKAPLKGSAAAVDIDNDGAADRVRAIAQTMPQVPWSTATIKFTSALVNNPATNCGATSVDTTLTGWSGSSATRTNNWFNTVGSCAPNTTITSAPPALVASTAVTFDFTSSIPGSTFECQIDGGTWQTCVPPQMFSGLQQGAHTICVRAKNGSAVDPSPECRTFTVDTVAPVVTVTCTGLADSPSRSCAWTVDDPSATVTCNLDGSALNPCPNPVPVNGYGNHTLSFTAIDPAGNSSTAVRTIVIPQPLVVAITNPVNGSNTTAASVNVAYTVNGSTTIPAGTACNVNNTLSTSASTNPVPLAMGPNTISVSCANAFGSSNTATVTVNRGTPPAVVITAPISYPVGTSYNVAYTVNGGTTIPAMTTCTVNGVASTNTQINTQSKSVNSSVSVTVACANQFGVGTANVFFPAPTVPIVVITSPANNTVTTASSINVAYTVNGGSTIPAGTTCTINGSASTSATSNTVAIVPGTNTITVTCSNAFGSDSETVVVTTSTPHPLIISPPSGTNTTASSINVVYTYNGSASIPSGVVCTINGVVSSSTTSNTVALQFGANTITLVCTSAFGSSTHTVIVNRGAVPSVVIVSPANGTAASPGQTINVAYTVNGSTTMPPMTTCTINGAPSTDPSNNPIVLPNPPSVTVICTNQFGASPAASITFISVPAPTVAITAPANNSWTTAASTNVRYTVNGSTTIPSGTTCTVNGAASTDSQVNSVALPAPGPHTITVQCTNAFGTSAPATVTVNRDNTPPTISNIQLSQWVSPGPSVITYSASDNSGIAPSCTPPSGSTIQLVLGTNVITVTCQDLAGNSASSTVTITISAPSNFTVSITGGPPPSSTNTTPVFTYTSSIPVWQPYPCAPGTTCIQIVTQVVNFLCTMDGASVPCGDSQYNSPPLQPGPHTFCVTGQYIPTGQLSNTACYSFTIVTTPPPPPVVTITSPTSGSSTTSSSTNVSYTVNGSTTIPSGTTCTVNGAASTSTTSNTVALAYGSNTITVACTSAAGTGSSVVTVTRTTSGFAPTFNQTFSSNDDGDNVSLTIDVTRSSGEEPIRRIRINQDPQVGPNFPAFGNPGDQCQPSTQTSFNVSSCPSQARIGTATFQTSEHPNPITGHIYVIAQSAVPRFGIDVNPTISGNPAGLSFQSVISTSVVQVDPACDPIVAEDGYCVSRLSMLLQDLPNLDITSLQLQLGGADRPTGSGTLSGKPFRLMGDPQCVSPLATSAVFTSWMNTNATRNDSDNFDCALVGPSLSISSPTNGYTQASTALLIYSVNPGDGDTPVCTQPSGASIPLAPGPNTITVTCTNSAGSVTATRTVIRDNTPPSLTILSPTPGLLTTSSSTTLLYNVNDDLDPNPICTPAQGTLPLIEGANSIVVTCTDAAGNVRTESVTVTRDSTTPNVVGSCTIHVGSSTCTFSVSEPGATTTCSLNGAPAVACTSPRLVTGLTIGVNYVLEICATDAAGNTGCSLIPITHGDPGPPQIVQYAPPSARTTDSVQVSFTSSGGGTDCRVDDGTWSPCSSPWTVPLNALSSPAQHTYEIRSSGFGGSTTGHIWVDDRAFNAQASAIATPNTLATTAASANDAGAHPDVTAALEVIGRDDAESVTVTFPDGLMGSLSAVPAADRCSAVDPDGAGPGEPQWKTGSCPLSSKVGELTGLLSTASQGPVTANGSIHLVDSAGIPTQYAAAVAIDVPNVGTGLGAIRAIGYLRITDNGRNVRLEATQVPRQTNLGQRFHLRSGSLTVDGDVGGAASPLITNPHFCGTPNPNRANANRFYGSATSYQGGTTPTVTAAYIVDNCAAQPFNPQVSTSFTSLAANDLTSLTTTLSLPADSSTIRQATVRLPSFVSPNLPSFGVSADQCPAGPVSGGGSVVTTSSAFGTAANTYNSFSPVNCPPQARAGVATIVSPLLPQPLTADIWLVNKAPIPNIGIHVDPSKYGNPQGVEIGLYGTTSTPQVDPTCDPLEGDCPTQIVAQFSSLPDVPVTSLEVTMGGVTGRVSSASGNPTLSSSLLAIADANDPSCQAAGANLIAQMTPWSGTASATRTQLIQPTGCNQ